MNNSHKEQIISGDCVPLPDSPKGVALRRFAGDTVGAKEVSTKTATFDAAAGISYHFHDVSEAITILEGSARVFVEGREYQLAPFDCVHVPAGTAHAMSNIASDAPMRAHSAFGASRPYREFVDQRYPRAVQESCDPLSVWCAAVSTNSVGTTPRLYRRGNRTGL